MSARGPRRSRTSERRGRRREICHHHRTPSAAAHEATRLPAVPGPKAVQPVTQRDRTRHRLRGLGSRRRSPPSPWHQSIISPCKVEAAPRLSFLLINTTSTARPKALEKANEVFATRGGSRLSNGATTRKAVSSCRVAGWASAPSPGSDETSVSPHDFKTLSKPWPVSSPSPPSSWPSGDSLGGVGRALYKNWVELMARFSRSGPSDRCRFGEETFA